MTCHSAGGHFGSQVQHASATRTSPQPSGKPVAITYAVGKNRRALAGALATATADRGVEGIGYAPGALLEHWDEQALGIALGMAWR
jgi:hypothetical protein